MSFLKIKATKCVVLLIIALALRPVGADAQAIRPDWGSRAYEFMGAFFKTKVEANDPRAFRLRVAMLPVRSPYADKFNLVEALDNEYLNTHQFIVTANTDSLLTAADFETMRQQLRAWQIVGKWHVRALRAQGVKVLVHDRRSQSARLFPKFITYQAFPPLFSIDGRTAFFYVENHCGVECAGGQIDIFRRQPDGSWKWLLGVMTFVS